MLRLNSKMHSKTGMKNMLKSLSQLKLDNLTPDVAYKAKLIAIAQFIQEQETDPDIKKLERGVPLDLSKEELGKWLKEHEKDMAEGDYIVKGMQNPLRTCIYPQ